MEAVHIEYGLSNPRTTSDGDERYARVFDQLHNQVAILPVTFPHIEVFLRVRNALRQPFNGW